MSNVFNVDNFLSENAITIEINKKKFLVKDVPFEFHDILSGEDKNKQKESLVCILGCELSDLDGYGIAATNAIIDHIMKSLFPRLSQNEASKS